MEKQNSIADHDKIVIIIIIKLKAWWSFRSYSIWGKKLKTILI